MTKLNQFPLGNKSSDILSGENQQAKRKHKHTGTNAEILTSAGIESVYLNRRSAIRYKCLDCSGFERDEVMKCIHDDCPLYRYRTLKSKQDSEQRRKAIKEYCMWCSVDQPSEINNCTSENCPLFIFRGYILPEKNALNRASCLENEGSEPSDDLSSESDSKIPQEEFKLDISTQVR